MADKANRFRIYDYPEYKPVRVQLMTYKGRKAVVESVYVFVGIKISNGARKALVSVAQGKKLSSDQKKILSREYGKDWMKVLGISSIQTGGDKTLSATVAESLEDEFDKTSSIPDLIPEERITTEDDLDIDALIKELDEPVVEEKKIAKSAVVNVKLTGVGNVNYIFDTISRDDNITLINKKLYAYTGIPMIAQNLSYIDRSNKENINLNYSIIQLHKVNQEPMRESLFNLVGTEELGIPIDYSFINEYDNKNLYIQNLSNRQLSWFWGMEDEPNDLILFNLTDIVNSLTNPSEFIGELSGNTSVMDDFYQGFITKYFPEIQKGPELISILKGIYKPDRINPGTIIADSEKANEQRNIIHSINKQDLVKFYSKSQGTKILQVSMKNNNPFEFSGAKINLRNIFDLLELNDVIPFVKFRTSDGKIIYKVYDPFYIQNSVQINKSWAISDIKGISFKIRISPDINNKNYVRFMTVNMLNTGRMEIRASWSEVNNANMSFLDLIIKTLDKVLLEKINSLGELVFEKTRTRFIIGNRKEYRITFLNLVKELTGFTFNEETYRELKAFTTLFTQFLKFDPELRSKGYQLYWRYIRSGNTTRRGFTMSSYGRNELLIQRSKEVAENIIIGKAIELSGINGPKIFISGARDVNEANEIINMFLRFIYIYRTRKGLDAELRKEVDRIFKTVNQTNKGIVGVAKLSTKSKKIRKLQGIDPNLFDYTPTNTNIQFYSRLCQGKQQPIILSDDEIKDMSKDDYIRITNKTRKDSMINYGCEDSVYRFPGFIPKDKHPYGFCLPCCFKKNSRINPKSSNYKTFNKCMRAEKGESLSAEDNPEKDSSNRRYLLNWKRDEVEEGRFSKLPILLNRLLNNNNIIPGMKCVLKLNMLQQGSKCFIISGISQEYDTFPRIVASNLLSTNRIIQTYKIRDQIINFWRNTIDSLKKHPHVFHSLEQGAVKKQFGTLSKYIAYLEGENNETIDPVWTTDLLSNHNSLGIPVNIIILQDLDDDITFICNNSTPQFIKLLDDPDRKTIIVLKSRKQRTLQQTGTTFYHPIIKLDIPSKMFFKISVKRNFDSNDRIVKVFIDMITSICGITLTDTLEDKMFLYEEQYGIGYMPTASELKKVLPKDYKITGQILDKTNNTIKFVVINGKIMFPVNMISNNIKGVSISRGVLGSIVEFKKFLDVLNLNISIKMQVITKRQGVGVILNTNYFVPLKKFAPLKGVEEFEVKENIFDINKKLHKGEQIPDSRTRNAKIYEYDRIVRGVMRIELSRLVYFEKNNKIRSQIKNKSKSGTKQFRDWLFNNKEISAKDFDKIQFNNFKFNADEFYDFDKLTQEKINKIISEDIKPELAIKKVREIIATLLNEIIHIGSDKQINEHASKIKFNNNIIQTCSGKAKSDCVIPQCLWYKGSCRVLITRQLYNNILDQFSNELVLNNIKRTEIFEGNVDRIINKEKYINRPNESIFIRDDSQ